jgi:hypothetical protein
MSRVLRLGIGVLVLAVLVLVGGWFDGSVMREAQRQAGFSFDPGAALLQRAIGYLLIAGGCLTIGLAGWRLRSVPLGIVYVVGGAFFTFLDTITWKLAAQINDTPPVLPEPMALAVSNIYFWQSGPLNAVLIIGAATLLVGLIVLATTMTRLSPARVPLPLSSEPSGQAVRP